MGAQRWAEAAEQLELLYGTRWQELAPLADTERADVLRAAIGFALGEDSIGLDRFREKYAAKMADGPDQRAFDVITTPSGTGSAEFRDVAQVRRRRSIRSTASCARCARAFPDGRAERRRCDAALPGKQSQAAPATAQQAAR